MNPTSKCVVLVSNTSWYLHNFRAGTLVALRRAGHRVICLAPEDEFSDKLVDDFGVEYFPLAIAGADRGALTELAGLLRTMGLIRRLRPRFVFNFTIKANIYAGLSCWLMRVPFANNISGLGTAFLHDRLLYRWIRKSYVWINARASQLFFQNPTDLELFHSSGLSGDVPTTVLPGSGVDLVRFSFQKLPSGPFTFLLVARLLGDKGVREYVEAARRIKQSYSAARFILVGPAGVNNATAIGMEEVRAWVDEGVIDYRGELPDVRDVLAECHVFVLPSYREGMPRTVLEAAAVGRPAIVSDVAGCRHAIEPGRTGWLCKPRSVDSLVDVMRSMVDSDRKTLEMAGQAARRLAEARFSEQFVVDAYLQCLDP